MYQNLKLEKGLYHLTNKSFVQALEALDPSAQYADPPLAGLDAYERQLMRISNRFSCTVRPGGKVLYQHGKCSAVPGICPPCCTAGH